MKQWYNDFVLFSQEILQNGLDYGVIPGVDKPSLLKPGAEKLRLAYGLSTKTEAVESVCDYDKGVLDFTYKTTVFGNDGRVLATCDGNANSFEIKFRYLWVKEHQLPASVKKENLVSKETNLSEFKFAIDKAETGGKYGKPIEYWQKFKEAIANGTAIKIQKPAGSGKVFEAYEIKSKLYRIDNPDVIGLKNTLMKMAQKRSFVGAMLIATGASQFYTQDVEDMEINGEIHSEIVNTVSAMVAKDAIPMVEDAKYEEVGKEEMLAKDVEDKTGMKLNEDVVKRGWEDLTKEINSAFKVETLNKIFEREVLLQSDLEFKSLLAKKKQEIREKIYNEHIQGISRVRSKSGMQGRESLIHNCKDLTEEQKTELLNKCDERILSGYGKHPIENQDT